MLVVAAPSPLPFSSTLSLPFPLSPTTTRYLLFSSLHGGREETEKVESCYIPLATSPPSMVHACLEKACQESPLTLLSKPLLTSPHAHSVPPLTMGLMMLVAAGEPGHRLLLRGQPRTKSHKSQSKVMGVPSPCLSMLKCLGTGLWTDAVGIHLRR
jgi:hypothetical protein